LVRFKRLPTGLGNPDANDLDRLTANPDGPTLCCCKPGVDEAGEHFACESAGEQQWFGKAARVDGEQL
jgi:hypothetical protein